MYSNYDFIVFLSGLAYGEITWTKNKRLTWNAGNSWFPVIAVDGPNIYAVWDDSTLGNREIYFKKGVLY